LGSFFGGDFREIGVFFFVNFSRFEQLFYEIYFSLTLFDFIDAVLMIGRSKHDSQEPRFGCFELFLGILFSRVARDVSCVAFIKIIIVS